MESQKRGMQELYRGPPCPRSCNEFEVSSSLCGQLSLSLDSGAPGLHSPCLSCAPRDSLCTHWLVEWERYEIVSHDGCLERMNEINWLDRQSGIVTAFINVFNWITEHKLFSQIERSNSARGKIWPQRGTIFWAICDNMVDTSETIELLDIIFKTGNIAAYLKIK